MEILQWSILFVVALAVLIKSADYFTNTAERIGLHFKISPFIIGVTIIALGTSLPEIATSIMAVLNNQSEMVIGNVVGSNLANILLVIGTIAIIGKSISFERDILHIDLPILIGSTILLLITTADGQFTYKDGIICLVGLITYMLYAAKSQRKLGEEEMKDIRELKKEERGPVPFKYFFILIISGTFLYLGAEYTIKAVVELSEIFNIATEMIALSAIAIGTSLPELAVSISAIKGKKIDMAIGNITGSNIFNVLGVMGIPALFGTLHISPQMISFAIPVLVVVTILYAFTTMNRKISAWEGMIFILIYITFLGKTFGII
jgi:cation:H+ antiporter